MFRILSIDGGGIRGIIAGQVLVRLESHLRKVSGRNGARIADYVDLVAGTSTGGILACALLSPDGYTAADAVQFYVGSGAGIFSRSLGRRIRNGFGLWDEQYSASGLEKALWHYFSSRRLSELRCAAIIPACEIERRKNHFFRSHRASDPTHDFALRDACRATSAAPTYFSPAHIMSGTGNVYTLIDGGVYANNPSMVAFTEAQREFHKHTEDMLLLSVGCGAVKRPYHYAQAQHWGAIGWARPYIDLSLSSQSEAVEAQARAQFEAAGVPNRFVRIQADLSADPETASMDNTTPHNVARLLEIGIRTADDHDAELLAVARHMAGAP